MLQISHHADSASSAKMFLRLLNELNYTKHTAVTLTVGSSTVSYLTTLS